MFGMNEAARSLKKALEKYDVQYEAEGLSRNLCEWECNKAHLLDLLRKDPNWVEEACAVVWQQKVECCPDQDKLEYLFDNLVETITRMFRELKAENWDKKIIPSMLLGYFRSPTITEDDEYHVAEEKMYTEALAKAPCKVGMKTTRYIRSLCQKNGIDVESKEFQEPFQKWADLLSIKTVTLTFVLSGNPADYATMSIGTNWASCHIINPDYARTTKGSAYNGCYKAGTLSYMNDGATLILYTVEKLPDDLSLLPLERKATRQCFYINEEAQVICQGRLYPYGGRDYRHDIYADIVRERFSKLWNFSGTWKKDLSIREYFHTVRGSLHYRDYEETYYSGGITGCNAFGTGANDFSEEQDVGNAAYCLCCGAELDDNDRVCCHNCEGDKYCCHCCNEYSDEDEMFYCDDVDDWVCENCVQTCDECETHFGRRGSLTEVYDRDGNRIEVCEDCLEQNYVWCDNCEEYHWYGNIGYFDDVALCPDCVDELTESCTECGALHLRENMTEVDGRWVCEECLDRIENKDRKDA